jgi:SAM-dependent methyltransferase
VVAGRVRWIPHPLEVVLDMIWQRVTRAEDVRRPGPQGPWRSDHAFRTITVEMGGVGGTVKRESPKQTVSGAEDRLDKRQRFGARSPAVINPGASTAVKTNVTYRLGKLRDRGLLKGVWLDCGCAHGGYTVALDYWGVEQGVGVEYDLDRVREAHARTATSATFACGSSEALPFARGSFDGVLLNEVLEHVPDEVTTLREIHRVLRPGGHLVVMSPNRWFPFEGQGMQLGRQGINVPIPFFPWVPGRLAGRLSGTSCARRASRSVK